MNRWVEANFFIADLIELILFFPQATFIYFDNVLLTVFAITLTLHLQDLISSIYIGGEVRLLYLQETFDAFKAFEAFEVTESSELSTISCSLVAFLAFQ